MFFTNDNNCIKYVHAVLEELIRQMTTFREDEFDEEDEDLDTIELGPEHKGGDDPISTEVASSEDTSVLSEVVDPKLAETTRKNFDPVEVVEKISFKTKCQLMQEEIDNGKCWQNSNQINSLIIPVNGLWLRRFRI